MRRKIGNFVGLMLINNIMITIISNIDESVVNPVKKYNKQQKQVQRRGEET